MKTTTILVALTIVAIVSCAIQPATASAKGKRPPCTTIGKPGKPAKPKGCKPCKNKHGKPKPCKTTPVAPSPQPPPPNATPPRVACNVVGGKPCPGSTQAWDPVTGVWMVCDTAPTYLCWSGPALYQCPPEAEVVRCSTGAPST